MNSLSPGGLQEHTDNIVVYFQGSSALENKIDKRVVVHNLNYTGLASLPGVLLKLRRLIKQHGTDIIHSHLNPAGWYAHLVCPDTAVQVHTLHTTYSMDTVTPASKLYFEKQLYFKKQNCNIILLSDFIERDFLKSIPFAGKHFVLNNFVEDAFFKTTSKEYEHSNKQLRIVAAGRLTALKNFEYLLQVFAHLKGREICLDIYGGGDVTKYEKQIIEMGINVKMMGHHEHLAEVISSYDLFIMPSKFEGFPLSLFEAMAAGVPLMLSDIAPLRSIVKEHAIYFTLDDDKAVAAILESVLDKQTDINELARNALVFANKTVRRETYITKLLEIYNQILIPRL